MLLFIIFLTLIIYAIFLLYKRLELIKKLPPGPTPIPFLGNVLQLGKDGRKTFAKLREIYGPVFTFWVGNTPFVYVCDFETMQESFIKHGDLYSDRTPNWLFYTVLKGNNGIVTSSGEQWKEQRRFALQTLKNFGFGKKIMEEKILEEVRRLLQAIQDGLDRSQDNCFNMEDDLQSCVGNVISSVLMGKTYSMDDPQFKKLKSSLDVLFKILVDVRVLLLYTFEWLKYVPLFRHFGYDDFKETNAVVFEILQKELEDHKKKINFNVEATDFIDAYLQEIKRKKMAGEDLSHFSEWQLTCVLYDLWIAGMETTASTMQWAFLIMLHNLEVQEKVQEEIDKVIGRERFPNMADKIHMPYTQAVLNEIQRYANIVPNNFPRLINKNGAVIGGYTIPVGVSVVPQISVCALNERFFPSPQLFDPGHYLEEDGKTLKKVDEFQAFSVGKRMCPGEGLARMEMFLIFTSLLQKYRLTVPERQEPPTLEPVVRFTVQPHSYQCCLRERN